ncbi:hypothetical protein PO124_01610 [Bacillus licheniformis]|nr:hypothetical protein [Bacillus licheniformis]
MLPEEVTPTDIGPTLNNWEEDESSFKWQTAEQAFRFREKSISEINYTPQNQTLG